MRSIDQRPAFPGPYLNQTGNLTVITAEKNGVHGIIFNNQFRPLPSGGCELDPDTMEWDDCGDNGCVYKKPFGGGYLRLLTKIAVAKQQLSEIFSHASDIVREADDPQK